ncbi:hypothetical protein FGG78_28400 [Thioclava sp. BHET1]|nr:hypothetical protein FGG78_28400 [Thioclava sp. BHET1]
MTAQDRSPRPMALALSGARIHDGIWTAVLSGARHAPELELLCGIEKLSGVELRADPEEAALWHLRLELPRSVLTDGAQALVLRDTRSGAVLAVISVALGAAAETDLRGEIALLRAELDLLKQAFRRSQRG